MIPGSGASHPDPPAAEALDPMIATAALGREVPGSRLLRVFGVAFGLAIIVGNTVGAGILRTPGEIAAGVPAAWAFFAIWVAGAGYAALGVINVAELATALPQSGGFYVFARHAFGPYAGFVIGLCDWASMSASTAAVAIALGEAVGVLVPPLAPYHSAVAVATVAIFTALLARGARESGRLQTLTSLLKALGLLVLIAACFLLPHAVPPASVPPAARHAITVAGVILALQAVIFTYDGWYGVVYFSEELGDPGREIPRSMFGGLALVAVLYLLLNAAFAFVTPVSRMAGEPFVAAAVARAIFGAPAYAIVSVLTVVILVASVNAILLMASRVPVALARDGLCAARAARVDARGTPRVALTASALLTIVFIVTGVFQTAIAVAAFFFVLDYLSAFAAVLWLRRREPWLPRPYRASGYPWTTLVALLGSAAFLAGAIVTDPGNSARALLVLALSYPAFRIMKHAQRGEASHPGTRGADRATR